MRVKHANRFIYDGLSFARVLMMVRRSATFFFAELFVPARMVWFREVAKTPGLSTPKPKKPKHHKTL